MWPPTLRAGPEPRRADVVAIGTDLGAGILTASLLISFGIKNVISFGESAIADEGAGNAGEG